MSIACLVTDGITGAYINSHIIRSREKEFVCVLHQQLVTRANRARGRALEDREGRGGASGRQWATIHRELWATIFRGL